MHLASLKLICLFQKLNYKRSYSILYGNQKVDFNNLYPENRYFKSLLLQNFN